MTKNDNNFSRSASAALGVVSAESHSARRGRSGNPLFGNCGAFFSRSAPAPAVRPLGARSRRLLCVCLPCFGVTLACPRCPSSVGALRLPLPAVRANRLAAKIPCALTFPPPPRSRILPLSARAGERALSTSVKKAQSVFLPFSFARAGS